MNNKTKMSNLESYQELSIQITCLDMKLNKILELLNNQQQWTVVHPVEFKSEPRIVRRNKDAFAESLGSEDEQFLENYK